MYETNSIHSSVNNVNFTTTDDRATTNTQPNPTPPRRTDSLTPVQLDSVTIERLEYILSRFLKSVSSAQRLGELLLKHGLIEVYGLPWPLQGGPRDLLFNLETQFCLAQEQVQRFIGSDSELISFADRMSDPLFGVPTFIHVGHSTRARACWQVIDGIDWIVAYAHSNHLSWSRSDGLQILQCLLRLKLIYPVELPEWQITNEVPDRFDQIRIQDNHSLFSLSVRVNRQLKPLFSREQIHRVCKSMRRPLSRGGLNVQDRRHFFRVFQQCFIAADAVDWLSQHLRLTFAESVVLANWMLGHGLFIPTEASKGKSFRDPAGWYRFRTNSRIRDYLLLKESAESNDVVFDVSHAGGAPDSTASSYAPPSSPLVQTDAMTGLPYSSSGALSSGSADFNWVFATIVHTEARLLLFDSTVSSDPTTVIDLATCFVNTLAVTDPFEYRLVADDRVYSFRLRSEDQYNLWTRALNSLMVPSSVENETFDRLEEKIAIDELASAQRAIERDLVRLSESRSTSTPSTVSSRTVRRDRTVSDLHSVQPPTHTSALSRLLSPFRSE